MNEKEINDGDGIYLPPSNLDVFLYPSLRDRDDECLNV